MRQQRLFSLLLIVTTLFVSGVKAEVATTNSDVRCLAVALRMQSANDVAVRTASQSLTLYYLGRIDGRSPDINLEDALFSEITKMTTVEIQSEARRCGLEIQTRGGALIDIGKNLTRRGNEQLQHGPK